MNGSIHREERPGRPVRYRVRWRERPGANPRSRSFARLAEARQFLAAVQAEQAARMRATAAGYDFEPVRDITVSDAIAEFLEDCRRRLAGATIEKYQHLAKYVLADPVLASQVLRRVRPTSLYGLLSAVADAGKAASTVQSLRGFLSALWAWAVVAGYAETNIVRSIRSPRANIDPLEALEPEAVMTPAQFRQMVEQMSPWAADVATVLVHTGLRIGEARALLVSDYNREARTLTISKSWSPVDGVKGPKTKAGARTVSLSKTAATVLDRAAAGMPDDAPLLRAARRFQPFDPKSFRRAMRRALQAAGLPTHWTPHSLRHTAISWWLSSGAPVDAVSRASGHSSTAITSIYRHWVPGSGPNLGALMDQITQATPPKTGGSKSYPATADS